jgi:hypothetical protein
MEVKNIEITKQEAEAKLQEFDQVMSKEGYIKHLKKSYEWLAKGHQIIDIYTVMKESGTKGGLPKLAIAPVKEKYVWLNTRGNFGKYSQTGVWSLFIKLPNKTFRYLKSLRGERYRTKVPIVPPKHIPKEGLKNYWILWEVENWEQVEIPPGDPILLKRISKNLFVVLAVWDLTPLEQSIVRGR